MWHSPLLLRKLLLASDVASVADVVVVPGLFVDDMDADAGIVVAADAILPVDAADVVVADGLPGGDS